MYELAYSTWDFDVFIVVALMNYLSLYCIVLYCIVLYLMGWSLSPNALRPF